MEFNNYFKEMMNRPSSSIDFMQALKRAKEESLELSNKSDNDSNRIFERIKKFNLILNPDTDNTGDCQFDSVCDQLKILDNKYDGLTKEEVRHIAIDWMRKNGEYKLNNEDPQSETLRSWVFITQDCLDWNSYCDKMSKAKEWGDEITFKSITESFNVKIVLISSTVDENNFLSEHKPKLETEDTKTIYLCHFLEVHYGSLITEEVNKKNEEKKKERLLKLLKRSNKTLQKKTILDIFCMDSPQNEIPRQLMEELIDDNNLSLDDLFENLQGLTNIINIKLHRINVLEDTLGPEHVEIPIIVNQNSNQGVVENFNNKIKALETVIDFQKKKLSELEEENENLKNSLSSYRIYSEKQNQKIEEYELSKIKDSKIPKKNQLLVEEILPKEIVLRWILTEVPSSSGFYIIFYKSDNTFLEKQSVPERLQGELYFQKPEFVDSCFFKLFNPQNEVLATSNSFIISSKIDFKKPVLTESFVEIEWDCTGSSSSYDWVGIFKADNPKQHLQYYYVSSSVNKLNFRPPTEKGTYKFQYFSGENKYLAISEISFEI